jgi:photosystem II stability/assembly factor-like uncharacterized protein
MFFTPKWKEWKRRARRFADRPPGRRRSPERRLLFLEPLEDRTLLTAAWTALGPAPLSNAEGVSIFPVSGRITGIAADPSNANVVYIATAGGGLWKTTNAGNSSPTWTPLTDNIAGTTDSMGAIAIAPSNDNVLYAGTGEGNDSRDSNYGEGILVSTNGGSSWTLENPGGVFTRLSVAKIAVDPTNADIAYAAVGADGPNGNNSGSFGVYKTSDGGATWTNTTTAITTSENFSDVAVDPNNPSIVYAAVGSTFGSSANGIYESSNGGQSWSLLSGFPSGSTVGRIALAISSSNPSVIYAVAATLSGQLDALEVSTDGGNTWTDRTSTTPNFLGGQGWYDVAIAVDPSNFNTVYVGGQGIGGIDESTNGGQSWTAIGLSTDGGSDGGGDFHAFAFDANGKLLAGSDLGIYRLDNNDIATPNVSWTDLNGNLNTIQFYGVSIDPATGNVLGGSQDNGTSLYSSTNQAWTQTNIAGDGGWTYVNGSLAYLTIFAGVGASDVFLVSNDGGQTWSVATNGINTSDKMDDFPPFAVGPNNPDRVLFGTNQIYLTNNAAGSWTKLTSSGVNGWDPSGNPVDALAIAASNANTFYAATGGLYAGSSQIFVSSDGGAAWTERDLPGGSGRVSQIVVDPTNAQTAYAVVSSFTSGAGHVWKTTNGGQSWTDISGNLPNLPTWSIQLDATHNVLYVGNDEGVFYSANGGTSWSSLGTGLPNAQVYSLAYSSSLNTLVAGTHGRGAWEISTTFAPQVTSNPSNATVTAGQTATFTAAANGNPTPSVQWYVSIDGGQNFVILPGDISPTLSVPNVTLLMNNYEYYAVFSNGIGNPATTTAATLTVNAPAPPTITSGASAVFTATQGGGFLVTATGAPTPTLTESGALPSGITFTDNGNGTASLSGTPAAGAQGTYPFSITAHNGVGNDFTQNFTLTINPAPPPPPAPPPAPPSLNVPPLLAFFNSFLGGVETVNANGTETITDSLFGFPLLVANFDSSGNLVSVTFFGIDVTYLFG